MCIAWRAALGRLYCLLDSAVLLFGALRAMPRAPRRRPRPIHRVGVWRLEGAVSAVQPANTNAERRRAHYTSGLSLHSPKGQGARAYWTRVEKRGVPQGAATGGAVRANRQRAGADPRGVGNRKDLIGAAHPSAIAACQRTFEYVVLSAVDDELASSALFGHVSGAFTDARSSRSGHFVTAAGGTLFLDEIGKASKPVQRKLLHAVEYREIRPVGSDRDILVDVRIVVASNESLVSAVANDQFLPDLFARLNVLPIELPALRERRADIPILVEHFIERHCADTGYSHPPDVHPDLMDALQRAEWPLNLRELDGAVLKLLIYADGAKELRLSHCVEDLCYLRHAGSREPLSADAAEEAIAQTEGCVVKAARLLGVSRSTVHRALKRSATGSLLADVSHGRVCDSEAMSRDSVNHQFGTRANSEVVD